MLQLNFTQVITSFDMGALKLSQFLQNKSFPSLKARCIAFQCRLVQLDNVIFQN